MLKTFKDSRGSSKEPARFIGKWGQADAFESTSIYMIHLVRLEEGRKVKYVYDPGRVWRNLYVIAPDGGRYKFCHG